MSGAARTSPPRAFAVVPAAGRSVRMGRPKLLLPWGDVGLTVIEQVLATWRQSRVERIVVTVHHDDRELADRCRACGVEVVVPAVAPPDMKASVRAALDHVSAAYSPAADDVWLVAPADLPLLRVATIDRVIDAANLKPGECVRPVYQGRHGHPVAFPWSAAAAVAHLPADRGIDALWERFPPVEIAADADCTASDLDTPDDYRRLQERYDRYKS